MRFDTNVLKFGSFLKFDDEFCFIYDSVLDSFIYLKEMTE